MSPGSYDFGVVAPGSGSKQSGTFRLGNLGDRGGADLGGRRLHHLVASQPQEERDPPAEGPPVCAECGRQRPDDENAAEDWRAYLDVDDELPVFCPECADREFGED